MAMIYIAADHRGLEIKAKIEEWLKGRGFEFEDLGAYKLDPWDDYVDYAIDTAQRVAENPENNRGIIICKSGVGMSIAANKVKKIRCGLGFSPDQVHEARKDDNINVLALAADSVEEAGAIDLVEMFLETDFVKSDSYLRRIEKIARYEREPVLGKRE
jgi:ribose 5-phosphate isomerase B